MLNTRVRSKGCRPYPALMSNGIRSGSFAGRLYFGASTKRLGPGEVRLHADAVPIGGLHADEQGIVVAMSYAGVHANAAGELANGAIRIVGNRRVHHAAREVEAAIVQIAEQRPDIGDGQVAGAVQTFIGDDGLSAVGKAITVAGTGKRGFEEGLRRDCIGGCRHSFHRPCC